MFTVQPRHSIDHYSILEVSPTASINEIKSAYKKKVVLCHPDKKGGSTNSFQTLQQSYEVLRDNNKRRQYDARRNQSEKKATPVAVDVVVAVTLHDVYHGCRRKVSRKLTCSQCKGNGVTQYPVLKSQIPIHVQCSTCRGSGNVVHDSDIVIPRGVHRNEVIETLGCKAKVEVKSIHQGYRRMHNNLIIPVKILHLEDIIAANPISIKVFDDEYYVRVSLSTILRQEQFCLRTKGFVDRVYGGRGDVIVPFTIADPSQDLCECAKKLAPVYVTPVTIIDADEYDADEDAPVGCTQQ